MNVLLISQCDKRALTESRRILDQFAERRGHSTWQTPITLEGLNALRRLLKKTARRNTSVACHWIRGRDHSELLWIVGDASRFNLQGAVPTNTTERDILRNRDENDWHSAEDIRLLAGLAALFHDFGKACVAFQSKLTSRKRLADAYRHEWVSLRLFQAFVGPDSDPQWLQRLATGSEHPPVGNGWLDRVIKDGISASVPSPFKDLPPLARAVGWLIVSHHRLPMQPYGSGTPHTEDLKRLPLAVLSEWNAARGDSTDDEKKACWAFARGTPFDSRDWCRHAGRLAVRMLARQSLLARDWLQDPYVAHISRLVLMLADHYYSGEPSHARFGDPGYSLYANTDRDTGALKQRLDEHLIGVAAHSGRIARTLPRLQQSLPHIARHKGFKRRSDDARFRWQDKAYDLAVSMQTHAQRQGFFGINMASTGCGKTLANGRILYGLADAQRGARFCIALGLRSLTLQTGRAYRERLDLGEDDLAVLVGGGAVRELHERVQQELSPEAKAGSESAEGLLPDNSYVHFEGSLEEGALKCWLDKSLDAQRLLAAPVLVCTIDHLMPATEGIRGGHQIAPILRLLTSDLVLDEPDDFDLDDLPALSRLVHWSGLLGSRVLLSSATLPPALVQGLFAAYLEGRRIFESNRGVPGQALSVCCAWFDEYGAQGSDHATVESFSSAHENFVGKRVQKLSEAPVRRRARIESLAMTSAKTTELRTEFAGRMRDLLHHLHTDHHSVDPTSGKRVSFGLVRMANIDPLIDVAQALYRWGAREDCRIHLCCYHARHPLLVRSAIEARLDRILKRHRPELVFEDDELRTQLQNGPERNHIFVVLASPVAEVGRDHDYDWAIVEPSSVRSIIQLAGRVRRHRDGACSIPNLYLLDTNLKHLEGKKPAFCHPGFEHKGFLLTSHYLRELLTSEQLTTIDARPCIRERTNAQPADNLADLEHERLRALLLGDPKRRVSSTPVWWTTRANLSGELQRVSPFRYDPQGRQRFVLLPDEDDNEVRFHRIEEYTPPTLVQYLLTSIEMAQGPRINFWGEPDYLVALTQLADEFGMDLKNSALRFGTVDLPKRGGEQGWGYHPALGFRGAL